MGEDCGESVCPTAYNRTHPHHDACSGHGTCHHDLKVCQCWYGWGGEKGDCSEEMCENLNYCNNNGYCDNDKCICDEGWRGDDCSTEACPQQCNGNGDCIKGVCQCNDEWAGSTCQVRRMKHLDQQAVGATVKMDPALVKALNEQEEREAFDRSYPTTVPGLERLGRDAKGQEILDPKFDNYVTAQLHSCPNFCGGNGECVLGKCKCDRGWDGEDCTTPLCPPHGSQPGKGGTGGRLSGIDMSKKGYTPHGYSTMEYFPCNGNGDCLNGVCACFMGWSGDDCSIVQSKGFTGPSPDMSRYLRKDVYMDSKSFPSFPIIPPADKNHRQDLGSVVLTPFQTSEVLKTQKLPPAIEKRVITSPNGNVIGYERPVIPGNGRRTPRHAPDKPLQYFPAG